MKLLYISMEYFDEVSTRSTGVTKKILSQVAAFEKLGMSVSYVGRIGDEIILFSDKGQEVLGKSLGSGYLDSGRVATMLKARISNEQWKIIYIRYIGTNYQLLSLYKECKKMGIRVVLEIPTYPYKQELVNELKGLIRYGISRFFNNWLKNRVDFVVTYNDFDKIYGVKTIQIENGVDVDKVPITVANCEPTTPLKLIAVGNLAPWHGFDRIISGMVTYYSHQKTVDRKVVLEIVGDGKELEVYKKMVADNNIGEYVRFHGRQGGKELDAIFANAHIAINSLGCHRIGLQQVSTIKSKEYLARGLPVIYATHENGFSENLYFCKRVSEDESVVSVHEIISFYEQVSQHENFSQEIRLYAKENLSWEVQMERVVKKIIH